MVEHMAFLARRGLLWMLFATGGDGAADIRSPFALRRAQAGILDVEGSVARKPTGSKGLEGIPSLWSRSIAECTNQGVRE